MKSWMLRLSALAIAGGLGTIGVMWAQHHFATPEPPPPDWSSQPVNAEAVSAVNSSRASGERYTRPVEAGSPDAATPRTTEVTAAGDRPAVDPFQGITQASVAGNSGNYRTSGGSDRSTGDHANGDHGTGAAYDENVTPASNNSAGTGNSGDPATAKEPRRLEADPSAAPIASDPARAAETNSSGSSSRSIPDAANDLRYVDNGARKVSDIAAATGTVEAVNDARQAMPPATSAMPNRYDGPGTAATNPADDFRHSPSAADLRALSDYRLPSDTRSLNDPKNIDSADAALARSMSGGPSTANAMSSGGLANNGLANGGLANNGLSNSGMPERGLPGSAAIGSLASASSVPLGGGFPSGAAGLSNLPEASVNTEGFGKPGDKKLEGVQAPSVTIEKIAPPEIQVGKEATFEIVVRNTGPVLANDVQVTDVIPQGTHLLNTTPQTSPGPRGEIVWKVGDMKPGEQSKLQIQVMPLEEGEIGSTAVVQFRSEASMRTVATKPDLVLEVDATPQVMIGNDVKLKIKLSNPGTGAANKVVLSARVPPNFQHPAGNELEFEVGEFKPGEARDLDLTLHAVQAGPGVIALAAQGDANLHVEKTANVEVVAPRLEVKLAGPGMRYLDRQAKYTVSVSNPGTAAARDITLTTHLPKGMQFVEASDSGQYDTGSNSVMWGLDELPPGQTGSVTLTALAKEVGDQKFRGEVKADGGLNDGADQVTVVEGVAEVNFTVTHLEDPVEVGGQATYEIHIVNQGSKAANRLQVAAVFPPEIKPVSGDGPSRQAIEGQRIAFEPLARLAPKAEITYRVVGKCQSPGDLRVQVLLQTDDMAKPVIKEDSTRVYKD